MTRLAFDITMSLDGFVTGPDPGPDQPLGAGGDQLHEWAYRLKSWREPHGHEGGADDADSEMLERTVASAGAIVMGRGMFGGGPGPWGDEPWEGWWGDEPPFGIPVFVLTHHAREPLVKQGTTFYFVTDGIESALDQARAVAGDRNVAIGGGASVAQQYLAAGLLDEMTIHIAPILLDGGVRLFDNLGPDLPQLEITEATHSPHVTHLSYRVVK
jgi:dihydrofolate reductase